MLPVDRKNIHLSDYCTGRKLKPRRIFVSRDNMLPDGRMVLKESKYTEELSEMGSFGKYMSATICMVSMTGRKMFKLGRAVKVLSPYEVLYLEEIRYIEFDETTKNWLKTDYITNYELYDHEDYLVYAHLRRMNYIVKPGHNYGGVFVIYIGHPDFFHSSAIVSKNPPTVDALTAALRVASSVKKSYMTYRIMPDEPDNSINKVKLYHYTQNASAENLNPLDTHPLKSNRGSLYF